MKASLPRALSRRRCRSGSVAFAWVPSSWPRHTRAGRAAEAQADTPARRRKRAGVGVSRRWWHQTTFSQATRTWLAYEALDDALREGTRRGWVGAQAAFRLGAVVRVAVPAA